MNTVQRFERHLSQKQLSENTIKSYVSTAHCFLVCYDDVNVESLCKFKCSMMQSFSASTVNQRIQAINSFLGFLNKRKLTLQSVKIQKRFLLDNVISRDEYERLKKDLQRDGEMKWYYLVCLLGSTGLRISEALLLKREDLLKPCFNLCGKGNKWRLLFLPQSFVNEISGWAKANYGNSEYAFTGRNLQPLTPRGEEWKFRQFAVQYGINSKVMHPHSFRHFFAKQFLKNGGSLALLADLLGHSSIETTRIYLIPTAAEVSARINRIVSW